MVQKILIKGVPDASSFTSGLITGGIQGGYTFGLATLTQLEQNKNVKVYQGPGQLDRRADRHRNPKGVAGATSGSARRSPTPSTGRASSTPSTRAPRCMPRWLANPGAFGYGKSVFTKAYDASPHLTQNLTAAKKLVQQAGAAGKTFTIGTSSQHLEHRRRSRCRTRPRPRRSA